MNFKIFSKYFPPRIFSLRQGTKSYCLEEKWWAQMKRRIFKLRIQKQLWNVLFPHIKKKNQTCLCSLCSKPRQQYNYPTQDSWENNVLGITRAKTEAQTFESKSELSRLNITDICADCHALRPTATLFWNICRTAWPTIPYNAARCQVCFLKSPPPTVPLGNQHSSSGCTTPTVVSTACNDAG